MTAPSVLIVCR